MRIFYKKPGLMSCIAVASVILLSICSFSLPAEIYRKAYLNAEELLNLYENMYSRIHNFHVYYTNILEDIKNVSSQMPPYVRFDTTETIEEGACEKYYTRWTHDPNGFIDTAIMSEKAFDGSITMQYGSETKSGRITPGRTGLPGEQMSLLWGYMLLHRPLPHEQPDKPLIRYIFTHESTVLPKLEQVNGHWCHVIDAPYTVTPWATVWLAVGKGGLPIKFERYSGVKDYMTRMNVIKVSSVETDTGTIWYPAEATKEIIDRDGYRLYRLQVISLKANIETSPDMFKVSFPPGTEVIDEVAGLYYTTDGTVENKSIDIINKNDFPRITEMEEESINTSEPIMSRSNHKKMLTFVSLVILGILAVCIPVFFVSRKLTIR